MTPELKKACEVVFQEHKLSGQPIKWNRDIFHGRISLGLTEKAKMTLVEKNIIFSPDKTKKIITQLNPTVAAATSFEEAEGMIENKIPTVVTSMADEQTTYTAENISGFTNKPSTYSHFRLSIPGKQEMPVAAIKWYLKPLFLYIVWPVCAAAAGALILFLLGFAYTELFLDLK
jgi:hypothetical protein